MTRLDALLAFAGYFLVDVVLAVGGYPQLERAVRRWPVRRSTPRTISAGEICAALDRAAVWYPRTRRCLARSAVATCLLRWHGLPVKMIVGARQMPFHAHAWVELDGQVLTDSPKVADRYSVLVRI